MDREGPRGPAGEGPRRRRGHRGAGASRAVADGAPGGDRGHACDRGGRRDAWQRQRNRPAGCVARPRSTSTRSSRSSRSRFGGSSRTRRPRFERSPRPSTRSRSVARSSALPAPWRPRSSARPRARRPEDPAAVRETPAVRRGGAMIDRDRRARPAGTARRLEAAPHRRRRSTASAPSSPRCARTGPSKATCCSSRWSRASWCRARSRGTLALRCARCLKSSSEPIAVEVHELFVHRARRGRRRLPSRRRGVARARADGA